MTDFSKCPSCSVPSTDIKNGSVRYSHTEQCELGRLESNYRPGCLGDPRNSKFDRNARVCSKCYCSVTYGFSPPKEGSWIAVNECPMCWTEAEIIK